RCLRLRLRRRTRNAAFGLRACLRSRDRRRCLRLRRHENGRIEQHCVFANETSARPTCLDEQRDKRLGDRAIRTHPDRRSPVTGTADLEVETREIGGPIDAVAGEQVSAREAYLEALELFRCRRTKLDFGVKRLM